MYSIYADGVCIYNDVFSLDNMKVVNPKLTLEDSAAGSLEMTLPPTNAAYDTIVRMVTDISVKKNGEEIWAGRALSESRDFWNNRVLYCEGELAFFNDSVQPPAEYAGKSVREYLDQLIAVHNGQVGENRRFAIGAVTVVDEAFPTYYTNYGKTLESLNALVEAYGGHLRVRKADGVRYLDYLKDYPDTCSQVIQFGVQPAGLCPELGLRRVRHGHRPSGKPAGRQSHRGAGRLSDGGERERRKPVRPIRRGSDEPWLDREDGELGRCERPPGAAGEGQGVSGGPSV